MNNGLTHEVVIIGAGPSGLTGACYLGRFRRPCIVLDGGASRARWIPKSHNTPGFPAGVGGKELLARLRDQALRYGIEIIPGEVHTLRRVDQGFQLECSSEIYFSQFVMLATGVKDELPAVPGTASAIHQAILKICPICDAFESTGKQIAVVGLGEHAFREAQFLQYYSDWITVINLDKHDEALQLQIEAAGIKYVRASAEGLVFNDKSVCVLDDYRKSHTLNVVFPRFHGRFS